MQKSLLVVDDFDSLGEILGNLAVSFGWNATLTQNAQDALEQLEHESPAAVLLNMRMAILSGFELARMLKQHSVYRNIPILGTSADPSATMRRRCLAAGCDDFISKPFSALALHQRLTFLSSALQAVGIR